MSDNEQPYAVDPRGQVERLADYMNSIDAAQPDRPAADQAIDLIGDLRRMLVDRATAPLPQGAWLRQPNPEDDAPGVLVVAQMGSVEVYVEAQGDDGPSHLGIEDLASGGINDAPLGLVRAVLSRAEDRS